MTQLESKYQPVGFMLQAIHPGRQKSFIKSLWKIMIICTNDNFVKDNVNLHKRQFSNYYEKSYFFMKKKMEPDLISISFIKHIFIWQVVAYRDDFSTNLRYYHERYISGDAIFHDLIARLYIQKSIQYVLIRLYTKK